MTLVKNNLSQFSIDAKASLFTVQAFASGIVAVVAHSPKFAIRNFSGSVTFGPNTIEDAALNITIKTRSLEIMDDVRANDRREIEKVMFDEVLESSRFPIVEYKSSRVAAAKITENMYRVNLWGNLTLHGATRGLQLDMQVMAGDETLKAQGSFSIQQSDFGLKIATVAGGSLTLKDELKFGYYIIARRQHE
jgi:polyisoprenoid-binding protein YceI